MHAFRVGLAASILLAACGGDDQGANPPGDDVADAEKGDSAARSSRAPSLSSLTPSRSIAGSPSLRLSVAGAGFVSRSVVRFGSSALTTTFSSATHLRATVPAALLATPGAYNVTVRNPSGATSGPVRFVVESPAPVVTALSPSSATQGQAGLTLVISGTGFRPSVTVLFAGSTIPVISVTPTQVVCALSATMLSSPGVVSVVVRDPLGASSNATAFEVRAPAPTLSSIEPASLPVGSGATTLTLGGTGFFPGSQVVVGGVTLAPTSASATRLEVSLPASVIAAVGVVAVTVRNPAPGGGASSALPLSIAGWQNRTISDANGPPALVGAGVVAAFNRVYVIGGRTSLSWDGGRTSQSTLWSWDPAAGAWDPPVPFPPSMQGRWKASVAYDGANGKIVVFGGWGAQSALGDQWLYDPVSGFAAVDPSAIPPALTPRGSASMTYDAARRRVLLVGGTVNSYDPLGGMFSWNGASWRSIPSERSAHWIAQEGIGCDRVAATCWIFGGLSDTAGFETADLLVERDGAGTFSPVVGVTPGPTARADAAAVLDEARGSFEVFGGHSGAGARLVGDAWSWDGMAWKQDTGIGPSARASAGMTMAPNVGGGVAILFGGATQTQTWNAPAILSNELWYHVSAAPVRCPSPVTQGRSVTVSVPMSASIQGGHWVSSGVSLVACNRYTITTSGSGSICGTPIPSADGVTSGRCEATLSRDGALVGMVSAMPPVDRGTNQFLPGAGSAMRLAPEAGALYLGIDDDGQAQTGGYSVTIDY